jgi:hypothetical protein
MCVRMAGTRVRIAPDASRPSERAPEASVRPSEVLEFSLQLPPGAAAAAGHAGVRACDQTKPLKLVRTLLLPTGVPAGTETRFRSLTQTVKQNTTYDLPTGHALGIEGSAITPPNLTIIAPELNATVSGNRVLVDWGFGGNAAFLDMIRLEVDRGDGKGWVFLANDTTPGYIDTEPFPATATKWSYRGIFMLDDAQVGQWSAPAHVLVGA